MALPGLVAANNLSDVADRERTWDNLGSSLATGDIAIPAPSLDLNFAANKSLVDDISGNNLITFSRASSGTFVGSNGLIQTAASGVPRFDHNPVTGESLGLLVEEARTNFQLYSNGFTNAGWVRTGSSITPNAITAPDGTITASKLSEDTSSGVHKIAWNYGGSPGASTATIFLKAAERTKVYFYRYDGDPFYATIDLQTGTINGNSYYTATLTPLPNGWYRASIYTVSGWGAFVIALTNGTTNSYTGTAGSGIFIWGAQNEVGAFPTSYIPTVASTVTRAADVASITGTNFSGWYRQDEGTLLAGTRIGSDLSLINACFASDATANNFIAFDTNTAGNALTFSVNSINAAQASISLGVPLSNVNARMAGAYRANDFAACINGSNATTDTSGNVPLVSQLEIGQRLGTRHWNSTISRLVFWPSRLNDKALQYITQPSVSSINVYSFSFAIKGRDVLALEDARNTSTRDFIFIKGLPSAAQPRLTAAAASTASGLALASNALLKLAPTSSGNYFFASGVTLSGVTTRINGTNALSIATSPFSGSTATAPLLFRELRPQANWRITEPMPSGTITSPEFAIPFETNDFVLFMKAGQN